MVPSEAVKQVLVMIEEGSLTKEEVQQNAQTYAQDSNPFFKVVGDVYLEALPFLQQSQQKQDA